MAKIVNMSGEQYRDLLKMLNEEIYKYAMQNGIDFCDDDKLIKACGTIKKINLGKELTELLLEGIMHYDAGNQYVLKFIDLEGISFAGRNVRRVDFRGTNADVDPQTVEYKNIEGANFEGIDMSDKCFDGCVICHTNLSYTNARIDPQNVYEKNLNQTKCDGLDLSQADFTGVYVQMASFRNAKINLDPQKVRGKCLEGTNLENVDMSGKDFSGCELGCCNLTNTNAVLDLNSLDVARLWGCKLHGTTLIVGEDFSVEQLEKQRVELGEIRLDDYSVAKKKIKSIFEKINRQ